jgi:putative RecB family exonuclease
VRISYTRFAVYRTCPQQYRLAYVDRIPVPTAPELLFGAAVHEALKFMYDPGHLRMPGLEEVVEAFVSAWQARAEEAPEDRRQPYFEQGVDILRRHYQAHAQREQGRYTAATEMFFSVPFADGHTLAGRFDRVDVLPGNRLEVVDYKTSRRMPTQQAMEKEPQLAIYRMAAEHLYPGQEVTTALVYVVHDYEMRVTQTPAVLAELQEEIRYVLARLQTEQYDPTPGRHCDWCAYRAHCPLFRAPAPPTGEEIDIVPLLREYAELSAQEKAAGERKAELQAHIEDYLDRCQAERAEAGGYVVERRTVKRVAGWDRDRLREVLGPLGLWEQVVDIRTAAVRALIASRRLTAEQRRQVEAAAQSSETKMLRVKRAVPEESEDSEE